MNIVYRMQTEADRDELIRLWSEQSGWDVLDKAEWERRFLNTPLGEAAISLAIDSETNDIIGQCIFIPTSISVEGKVMRSYRTFAPLLHQKVRGLNLLNPLKHPIYRMYKFATNHFAKNGIGLVHSMPDPRWLRAFQLLRNFYIGKFPLWSLELPLSETFELSDDYKPQTIGPENKRLDELWQKTSALYDCAIVRNSNFMPWKTSHGDYFYQGVFRGSELVGFVSSIYKERDKQWLICDILAADTAALKAAICVSCNQAHEFLERNPSKPVNKVAILTTGLMLPIVKDLGFYRDEYDFPLVVHLLDNSIPKDKVAPSRWYLSAND